MRVKRPRKLSIKTNAWMPSKSKELRVSTSRSKTRYNLADTVCLGKRLRSFKSVASRILRRMGFQMEGQKKIFFLRVKRLEGVSMFSAKLAGLGVFSFNMWDELFRSEQVQDK